MVIKKLKNLFSRKEKPKDANVEPVAKKAPVKKASKKKAAPKKKAVSKRKVSAKKATKKTVAKKKTASKASKAYDNRFQKFYDLNKERINEERRKKYKANLKKGLCVRCNKKALKGIKLCRYHRDKQREYNKNRK